MTTQVPIEFKANVKSYDAWLKASLWAGLSIPIYVSYLAVINHANVPLLITSCLVAGGLTYLIMRRLVSRSRVIITKDSIIYYGVSGRKRTINRNEPIIGFFSNYKQNVDLTNQSYELLILKNKNSHTQMRIMDAFYDHDSIAAIAKIAGISHSNGTYYPKDIDKKQPGIMKFYERHPNWTITIWTIGSFIVIAALIFVFATLFNPVNSTHIRFS